MEKDNKIMTETEFKDQLRYQVAMKNIIGSVADVKRLVDGYLCKEDQDFMKMKEFHDKLPLELLDDYLEKSWQEYKTSHEFERKLEQKSSTKVYEAVEFVEKFGYKDYEFKAEFKKDISAIATICGLAILSSEALAAIIYFIATLTSGPSKALNQKLIGPVLGPMVLFPIIALYFALKDTGVIKHNIDRKKMIKILKENGLYDSINEKMLAAKELATFKNNIEKQYYKKDEKEAKTTIKGKSR